MSHGTYVGEVDGLTEGAFGDQLLEDVAHGTIDNGKVALLHGTCVGTCVGEVDGLCEVF